MDLLDDLAELLLAARREEDPGAGARRPGRAPRTLR
jgi:hypothetical protein